MLDSYEIEYLKIENEKLKNEINFLKKNKSDVQNDVSNLIKISIEMKRLLELCRQQTLPLELGRQIDKVIKEVENY